MVSAIGVFEGAFEGAFEGDLKWHFGDWQLDVEQTESMVAFVGLAYQAKDYCV